MKKFMFLQVVLMMVACSSFESGVQSVISSENEGGLLSVKLAFDDSMTRSTEGYVDALDEEVAQKNVTVMVFDKESGMLNASKTLANVSEECSFNVSVGEKIVWALVNFENVDRVISVSQLQAVIDDLRDKDILSDGLAMAGSDECEVISGEVATPGIYVRRLVSRVVLQKVTVDVPEEYGNLTLDCVFLGNANVCQTISGAVSEMVNPDGYSDVAKTSPVGKDNVTGSCPGYMYRELGIDIEVGSSCTELIHMYSQPNVSSEFTNLYLLTTIGGSQYYYKVPLHNGLKANTTYSVEVTITNLGAPLPPDGDLQKGEIQADIYVAGWDYGESYIVEF